MFLLIVWTHAEGNKNDRFDFKLECLAKCRDLEITIKHKTGDVDLYGTLRQPQT